MRANIPGLGIGGGIPALSLILRGSAVGSNAPTDDAGDSVTAAFAGFEKIEFAGALSGDTSNDEFGAGLTKVGEGLEKTEPARVLLLFWASWVSVALRWSPDDFPLFIFEGVSSSTSSMSSRLLEFLVSSRKSFPIEDLKSGRERFGTRLRGTLIASRKSPPPMTDRKSGRASPRLVLVLLGMVSSDSISTSPEAS